MSFEIKQMELQAHLAEYSALRDEVLSLIKWRDSLVFISLSITGALFSFAFTTNLIGPKEISTHWTALYLVTPLSCLVGGLWMVNSWRIFRIGNYLNEVTATKINALLNSYQKSSFTSPEISVLEWQSSSQRIKFKWERRIVEWLIYILTFVISGFLAQLLLLRGKKGSLFEQILDLEFPIVYILNMVLIVVVFFLFVVYLRNGKGQFGKSNIQALKM